MQDAKTVAEFFGNIMRETIIGIDKDKIKILSIRSNGVFKADEYLNSIFNAKKFYKANIPLSLKQDEKEGKFIYRFYIKNSDLEVHKFTLNPSFYQAMLQFVRHDPKHPKYPNCVSFAYSLLWYGDLTCYVRFVFESEPSILAIFLREMDLKRQDFPKAVKLDLNYIDSKGKAYLDAIKNYLPSE